MDRFIQNDFHLSVENNFCKAYVAKLKGDVVAIFALSFDSIVLDDDDKEDLQSGLVTDTPGISPDYDEIFCSKTKYPALDIAYLAVSDNWRGQGIGTILIDEIAQKTRSQSFAGCLFLVVDAFVTHGYSAVGFYSKLGFSQCESMKAGKDTIRMYKTLYPNRHQGIDE